MSNNNSHNNNSQPNTYQSSPYTLDSSSTFSSDSSSSSSGSHTPVSVVNEAVSSLQRDAELNIPLKKKKQKVVDYRFPFHFAIHSPRHNKRTRWRYKLGHFIESNKVQTFIVSLIILDLIIAIIEMFLEESFKKCKDEHEIPHAVERTESVLRVITLVILGIFEIEIIALMLAFGRDFFFHPFYVLDLVVITTSIVVDVVFRDNAGALLVIFRLWRVVRIGHGIAMSVEDHDERKYSILKKKYKELKKSVAASNNNITNNNNKNNNNNKIQKFDLVAPHTQ
ncbi:hypothetical protein PPL_10943 [Heterostelium album PN500]|uniref:Voltage-gated hydrogen channel 1 n=1 Tax=Heterostelium pallidum (strain ATCC 26659 / Pp 5 / PN500) TaxID=670386 RepID=D3BSH5_HETP5|nr:hypothetical protein PPL_10943 [Heterostelium album PN500]EFA75681.1 hypothetical protein PPL_10943 [Heterostelium album PN500]|eukprot:XP_020427815.1 hypothetical protein PPL_10943 [Heterostelium album PN500]